MADYGVDIGALDDLPDPEQLIGGDNNAVYAAARRLLTPTGALAEIGETVNYDSLDLRDWLGQRISGQADIDALRAQVTQALLADDRVSSAAVDVQFNNGAINVSAQMQGADGPFSMVLSVSSLTVELLRTS